MKKAKSISFAVIGVILVIAGIYRISTAFNKPHAKDPVVSTIIGETIKDKNGVEFCVTNVTDTKTIGEDDNAITTKNNFVVVSINITNNSSDPYDVNTLRFLLTENGNEYEYDADTLLLVENHMFMDTINPKISKEYVIVYEAPSTHLESNYDLKIKPIGFSEKDSVFISLRSEVE